MTRAKAKFSRPLKPLKTGRKAGTKKASSRTAPPRALLKAIPGNHAKARHMRDRRGHLHAWDGRLPTGLVAKPIVAQPKSKHRSYFEFVENREKKKKLEFKVTNNREPTAGYEFVPIGNPALTAACKELSREQEAMVFIVSLYNDKTQVAPSLSKALNRIGHHFRESIVQQARASLGEMEDVPQPAGLGVPEPIPETQEEINKQADAAIRDLFPRIPNTDRQTIIEHSFRKGARSTDGMPLVGLAAELTLSRRVQLAVISHVRHTHTRYDQLLRETTWVNARRAVENLCLDILVKWRGDEESGRDQLDEILREVVVISDSEDDYEDEDEDDDDDDDDDSEDTDMTSGESSYDSVASTGARPPPAEEQAPAPSNMLDAHAAAAIARPPSVQELTEAERVKLAARRAHRGFQRYQAVRDQAWQQALVRQRQGPDHELGGSVPAPMGTPQSQALQRPREVEANYQAYGADHGNSAGPSSHHTRHGATGSVVNPQGPSRLAGPPPVFRNNPDLVTVTRFQPPAYYHDRGEGQNNGANAGNAYAPMVGPHPAFRSSPERRRVGSGAAQVDLKDYLVPSIEPTSPLANRFSTQTLDDRRQDPRPEQWQLRPALQQGDTEPQYASPNVPDEGFIRVYRQIGNGRHAEPAPTPYRTTFPVAPRDSGFTRPDGSEPVSYRPVAGPGVTYRPASSAALFRNDHTPVDDTYMKQGYQRFPVVQDHRGPYAAAPETRRHMADPDDGSGARYRDVLRPVVVEDERTWRQPPPPADGSGARYRDASRPIVVEDERTWRGQHPTYPAFGRVGEEPEQFLIRRPAFGEREVYTGHQVLRRADPPARVPEDDRRLPLEFIPVSNMFPRPHEPEVRRDEARGHIQAYPRGAPVDGRSVGPTFGHGYDQQYQQYKPDDRAYLPRQERVVRYEFVKHGQMDAEQTRHKYDNENLYRSQVPSTAGVAPGAAYGAPSAQRPSRQEGVIYLE